MLLRSSSTPVLGSLLPSFAESPNNIPNHHETKPTTIHHCHSKLSFHQTGSLNLSGVSCNSSPISPSIDCYSNKGFRRAQSEGNLEGLAFSSGGINEDQFRDSHLPKKFARRSKCMMLQTIPSFSFYNSRGEAEDEEEEEVTDTEDTEEREEFGENEELFERGKRGGDAVMAMESTSLGLENMVNNMTFTEEVRIKDKIWNVGLEQENELVTHKMYLAKGLGVGVGGGGGRGGGSGDFNPFGSGGDEGDKQGVEEYYKRMVEENPGNPLFLRNYAQFLYETKGDLRGAEEYYSRAILADPKDGDVLSQYAKLVWQLHNDQDTAASYFERAVQASPQDSHVHAAYANFLWETEDDEDEADVAQELHVMTANLREGTIASATA
ncbi:Signal transduction response regulator [Trema orientale]|uniref:Signal transduction response regulator n=1 Tax=Trema orientale TaxID=63057 RepID=A0A2P5D0K6_TREOI|nr:Signal transduction response regulator [Trema orientale]